MSLRTTKKQAQAQASAGLDRAREMAAQLSPAAKDAMARLAPLAKNAGATASQSVQEAGEWARPRLAQGVQDAREWVAPRIEQAGQAISDTVAPKVSEVISETVAPKVTEVMTATARRIEPARQTAKRRIWPKVAAALTLAGVLGTLIAIVLRKRASQAPDDIMTEDTDQAPAAEETEAEEVIVEAEVGANGDGPTP